MFNGLNNRLANVPTATGLSNVTADIVDTTDMVTDTLTVGGIDIGTQVATNTIDITNLKQITTGQSYSSGSDTTTFDNNVTLTDTKILTTKNIALTAGGSIVSNSLTISDVELGYMDGVTSNIQTQLNNRVDLTTAQSIGGIKTFTTLPESSVAPTTANQLTNKTYVDTKVSLTGAESIGGIKTFTSLPESSVAPTTANQLTNKTYVDTKVSLTGAETIAGIKTFSSLPESSIVPTTANQLTNKTYVDNATTGTFVTLGTAQTITAQKIFSSSINYFNNVGIVGGNQLTLQDSTNLKTSNIFQNSNDLYLKNNVTSGFTYFQNQTAVPATTTPFQISSALCSFNNTDVEVNNTKNLTLRGATKLVLADSTVQTSQVYQSANNLEIYNTINSGIININARSAILGIKVPMSIDASTVTMRAGVNIANLATTTNFTTMLQDGATPSNFNIVNNVTSGKITMSCEDATGTARPLLDLSTTNTCIGGNGTDYEVILSANGDRASTTAKIMRIFSNTSFAYIDTGVGYQIGSVPLLFRSGAGLERFRTNDTGILMANTNMYGRNDGDTFLTAGATQPIGFCINQNVSFTPAGVLSVTLTGVLLDAGVWIMNVTYQLTKNLGTFGTGSYIQISLTTGTGYTAYPSSIVAGARNLIPSNTTVTTCQTSCSSTLVVTNTGRTVTPVIATQTLMTLNNASGILLCGFTKIA